jgi:hypothetical protein
MWYDVTNVTCNVSDIIERWYVGDMSVQQRWLLLIYKVPQDPPGRRTYVWRQLKQETISKRGQLRRQGC